MTTQGSDIVNREESLASVETVGRQNVYALIFWIASGGAALAQVAAPGLGEVIPLGGTPSDIVLDEDRGRLYLGMSTANRVNIYKYREQKTAGSLQTGTFPLSAAMSMGGSYLYVTNTQSSSLTVTSLANDYVLETVSLPARPEGVATGVDGRVVITTQGTGTNNALTTLLIYDRNQVQAQQITPVQSPPQITTPAPLPALFVGRPATPFPGRRLRTPDGQFIVGMVAVNQTATNTNTALFVCEVASGVVLKNRTVTGQSTVLSMSPDGSEFMAGSTFYDTAALAVSAQMNTANLPFFIAPAGNPAFNIGVNYGGSLFAPDGETIYSAFNTAAANLRPTANVLYVSSSTNLGVKLGLRLPQSILGKIVATSEYPILRPETTQVFLAVDECNKGVARSSVRVVNLGTGKLTFSVPTATDALVTELSSGVAPATIDFIMQPGRSGIVRQPGTNVFNGGGNGVSFNITLASQQAINFPNTICVYMNYRQPDQRGIVFPRPVSLNNAQGLQELLLDETRGRVYITNAGYNRIEIFDAKKQKFFEPLEVGQLPRSMAMPLDSSILYVGNAGGESIAVVDLDTLTASGSVAFPPIPRAGNQNPVQLIAMAMGLSGLQFLMSNGTFWRVVGNEAVPRPANAITPASIGAPQLMIATPGGEYILTVAGNGTGYLYDARADTYTAARALYDQAPVSCFAPMTAAPGANSFVVSGMILSSGLSLIGGSERPGATQTTFPTMPGQPPVQTVVSAGQRNVAAVFAIGNNRFVRLTTPVRQNVTAATRDDARATLELVDTRTGAESVVGVAPANPVTSIFGNTRANVPPRQLAVDSNGITYAITLSGLSVIPMASAAAARPQIAQHGIVNSTDGTAAIRAGSFIIINGTNLAAPATAMELPLPTVLGGSCVVLKRCRAAAPSDGVGSDLRAIPAEMRPGQSVVQVRTLMAGASSDPMVLAIQRAQ
jgi:hypothetical protein